MAPERTPSERLRDAAPFTNPLHELDPELPLLLAAADEASLRAVARHAAERAAAVAGLTAVGESALDGLPENGDEVWTALDGVEITEIVLPGGHLASQQHAALPAIFATADPDPLVAALNAVHAAAEAHGADGYRAFLDDVRDRIATRRPCDVAPRSPY